MAHPVALNIVGTISNVYFTNLCNYRFDNGDILGTSKYVKKGRDDLERDIKKYKPRKIVCLGRPVYTYIMKRFKNCTSLLHPSIVYVCLPALNCYEVVIRIYFKLVIKNLLAM